MSWMLDKFGSRHFLMVTILLQFAVLVLIFLDVPIARQVVGFIYMTFFPGFIITKLLRLNNLEKLETVLFSVGFSIAFLMFAGLLINEVGLLSGVSKPLSLMPFLVILNSFVLLGVISTHLRGAAFNLRQIEHLRLPGIALLFMSLPILSIIGAMWVNAFESNFILLFLIVAISALFVIAVVSRNLLSPKLYSIAVLMIAISLLFHASLISEYLVSFGSDSLVELYIFKTTEKNALWNSTLYTGNSGYGRFNAMLSITILPTFFSSMLNMDPTWVFKILFPLVFSLIPLGLFQTWRRYVGGKCAFISAFVFMAQLTFYNEMLGLNRQIIAELFFALLFLVILNKRIKTPTRMVCFIIFSFALVTSHYGLSEIFLFLVSLTLISLFVVKRSSGSISASMVVFFFIAMFTWYIYTSGSATFESIVNFGTYVYDQLGEFSNVASRGSTVMRGLGLESAPTNWNMMSRAIAYITQAFIVVGFAGLILNRVKAHVDGEYLTFTSISMVLLAALIVVPGLANTMNMTRFYHILLFFLAPLCVLGAEALVKLISKRRTELLVSTVLLIVLVPYFLFQTSFVYEIVGAPSASLSLSKHQMKMVYARVYMGYFDESEVVGTLWMSRNMDNKNSTTYADLGSVSYLIGYGAIYINDIEILSNVTVYLRNSNIYLNRANLGDAREPGIVVGSSYVWNTTSILPAPGFANEVYSNGGCDIRKTWP